MLGGMSLFHWIIVLAVVLLLFGGKNKISDLMGDVAKGVKSFKKGLNEDETASAAQRASEPARTIDNAGAPTTVDKTPEVHKVG
ncbi:MAG: twin-arginine translocase TatA/TatE family subunit [Methylobacteriaceae bacterium]|nr:twin-arginine translocase TatA/TatE family subunit [Methylobacteriaceae bacterium]